MLKFTSAGAFSPRQDGQSAEKVKLGARESIFKNEIGIQRKCFYRESILRQRGMV